MRLAENWYATFISSLERHEVSRPLADAAAAGHLGQWTSALTRVVVDVCQEMGWHAAAKGYKGRVLPIGREEYLALDGVAFAQSDVDWPFPIAVFELENSPDDDKVAYSLWKVLCVRARLRVVFCYRADVQEGSALVGRLAQAVVGSLPVEHRVRLVGQTSLVVGSRAEESTFPYGFFKQWLLDKNTGMFVRT